MEICSTCQGTGIDPGPQAGPCPACNGTGVQVEQADDRPELERMRELLDQVGAAIGQVPPYAWRGWVVYLLNYLEHHTDSDEYCQALQALQADIAARLKAGHW